MSKFTDGLLATVLMIILVAVFSIILASPTLNPDYYNHCEKVAGRSIYRCEVPDGVCYTDGSGIDCNFNQ